MASSINVSSVMGRLTLPGHGSYAATKFALGALSESLAMEVRPFGVRVVLIEPGVILTPIWGKRDVPLPEGHAYAAAMARLMRIFGSQFEGGTPPEVVAEAIWHAAQHPDPPSAHPGRAGRRRLGGSPRATHRRRMGVADGRAR